MRKLHLVGFTTDLDGLIFSSRKGAKTGSFVVALGDDLVDTIAEAQRLRNGDESERPPVAPNSQPERRRLRAESALTPREIQARIRAGHSMEDVAVEAGVDLDWIERFAVPILAEQARVVEQARAATYSKPRRGESALPLGPSVAQNLSLRGAAMPPDGFDSAWAAHHLHGGVWMISFRYRSRGRPHEAAWTLEVATNQLLAANRLGSELGYVDKLRYQVVAADDAVAEPDGAAGPAPRRRRAPAVKKAAAKKPAARPAKARAATAGSRSRSAASRNPPKAAARPARPKARTSTTTRPRATGRTTPAPRRRTPAKTAAPRAGTASRGRPAARATAARRTKAAPRKVAPARNAPAGRSRATRSTRSAAPTRTTSRAVATPPARTVSGSPATDGRQAGRRAEPVSTTSRASREAPSAAPATTDRRAVVASDAGSAPAAPEPARRLGGAIALGSSAREAEPAQLQATPDAVPPKASPTGFRARIAAHRASEVVGNGSGSGARRRDTRPREASVLSTILAPA